MLYKIKVLSFVMFFGLFWSNKLIAQITFSQDVYLTGQDVVANGTDLVIGVENGIPTNPASMNVSQGTKSINLGQNSQPGLYIVSFTLADNSKQSFLIAIGTPDIELGSSIVESRNSGNVSDLQKNVFKQVFAFFQNLPPARKFQPFTNGLRNYCINNAVDLVHNVAFCFAAATADGSLEILNTMCIDMTVDNLKSLTLKIYKELFKEMLDGGYITQQQYEDLDVSGYVNLAKMLQKDCSGFFDYLSDQVNNDGLKIAIKYQGQLCTSAIAIVKEYKKIE